MTSTDESITPIPESLDEGYTDDLLTYLPGVDPAWAQQYIKYSQRMQHFSESVPFFYISPRVVKIAVLRPESMVRLIRNRHAEDSSTHLGEIEPFEQSKLYLDREKWNSPIKKALLKQELSCTVQAFHQGLSPMEALQIYHANAEDGDENEDLPPSSPPLLEMFLVIGFIAMIFAGALSCYSAAKEAAERNSVTASESQSIN